MRVKLADLNYCAVPFFWAASSSTCTSTTITFQKCEYCGHYPTWHSAIPQQTQRQDNPIPRRKLYLLYLLGTKQ